MLELSVATACSHEIPAVVLKQAKNFAHPHSPRLALPPRYAPRIISAISLISLPPNVRVEQRAAVFWMLALYPSRVCSNALLGGELSQTKASTRAL